MRRRVGLLVGLLVIALGTGVVAQEPSPEPPPWFGGRVEMPEHGFAVTLPDDWEAFDLTSDLYEQARRYVAAGSLDTEEDIENALSAFSAQVPGQLVAWSSQYVCTFDVVPGTEVELGAKVDRAYSILASDDSIHVEPRAVVDLPVGTAHVATYRRPGEEATVYIGEATGSVFDIYCYGWERPDDSWLSIAERFEVVPRTHGPVVIGGRIEVPDAGFAIDVPDGWLAAEFLPVEE